MLDFFINTNLPLVLLKFLFPVLLCLSGVLIVVLIHQFRQKLKQKTLATTKSGPENPKKIIAIKDPSNSGNGDEALMFVWGWGNVALIFGIIYSFETLFELFEAFGILGLVATLIMGTAIIYNFIAFFILLGTAITKMVR